MTDLVINTGLADIQLTVDTVTQQVTLELAEQPGYILYVNTGVPGGITADGVQSLSNKTLLDFKLDDAILDAAGAVLLQASATASAVNYVTIFNAATGNSPGLTVGGAATDADLLLSGKGSGVVKAGGYEVLTTNTGVTPAGSATLSNKELDSPKLTTGLFDTNGNELIKITATASAVNEITVANAATGSGPTISATGGDTNIDLNLASAGTGSVKANGAVVATAGKQTAWVPALAMTPRTTNGAARGSVETATNKVMISTLDFDAAVVEYAQFWVKMPNGWNEGTVSAVFECSHGSTTTNFGMAFSLAAVAINSSGAIDVARGTAQTVTVTGGTTDTKYSTSETAAVTIAGTPAAGALVLFEVARQVANAGDTMAIDARLHGLWLLYTTDAANDA